MAIQEISKIEEARTFGNLGVVHLFREGNFYRAYDWSAWLMSSFPIGESKNKPLQVSAKQSKEGYITAWVGFPVSSLNKFIPDEEIQLFNPIGDKQIDVTFNLPEEFVKADVDKIREAVDEWKRTIPLSENKKQKREGQEMAEMAPRVTRITDVLSCILSFPLESKSPLEAWEFLRQLRRQVTAIY